MRIVLLYPPPWKIPAPGETPDTSGNGPPKGATDFVMGGDFCTTPYGLLTLYAQAARAGHRVKLFNLAGFPWRDVDALIRRLDADIYGLSCFTCNRRGTALTARCIREHHRAAHIVVGGPHVTALSCEMLRHHRAIDTVVLGEGETTFLELVGRLEAGEPTDGIAGTAWRDGAEIRVAPPRQRIDDLDSLAPVHQHFAPHVLLTSRGCPGQCTYCASNTMWGRKLQFHSVEYVLDAMAAAARRLPVKILQIKDDTFTCNRRRALEICRGILDRKLNILWNCDTRADALDEELLRAMRLAGCQVISLGVESAAPEILRNVRKNVTPEQVLEATRLARKFGFQVRYYMMAGNRGETVETFKKSVDFLQEAKPNEFLFGVLTFYPGTEEFEIQKRAGGLTGEVFFKTDMLELWAFADASPSDAKQISRWLAQHAAVRDYWQPGVDDCRAVLERLPDLHAAHMDLGGAHFRAGQWDPAEQYVRRAMEMGYPLPSLGHNYLACIAGRRGDIEGVQAHLERAVSGGRLQLRVVRDNTDAVRAWLKDGGAKSSGPLKLAARHDFNLTTTLQQPMTPGPLPPDACDWQ